MAFAVGDKLKLIWLRRNEYESTALRDWFSRRWKIEVGLYSYGCFDPWRISAHTRIGRYCSFARSARVIDQNHPLDALTTHPYLYERRFGVVAENLPEPPWLQVEDDVWVGHNATILPGCKFIGRGAVIAAGAIINQDIPRYAIAAGMPGRVLRQRFDAETIAAIEASQWWLLDKLALRDLIRQHPAAVFHPDPRNLAAIGPTA
ncbi:chloramphenicol acetyltransferase [Sandarakinorhabdus cyanobacteriorum]|uniref:Chloramphenicol acetyltransferase n=1 Tax=Sandarakinorhabdus cyanobacteriorum TaxID=1981098 RepID=A0A255YHP0_9SPHN|nr:CatB-related O-acetyltransferase [Sandarakinorhabdus cyanobacteriorum]OYQ28792.1 chloramphenicol acetyltransferase [Sandarakinorhabdus cyanobacteriorum]